MASSTSATSNVYINVIGDVISKVRDEFMSSSGPGESVLNELQGIWEMKMMQAGAIVGPIDRSSASKSTPGGPITPVHDLNVPYEGTEEYETPTADLLFPPTPLQTPIPTPLAGTGQTPLPGTAQTPLPGTAENYNIPTGETPVTPAEYPTSSDNGSVPEVKGGRPNQYMDFFSGKRKREDIGPQYQSGGYIPQQDGATDDVVEMFELKQGPEKQSEVATADKLYLFGKGERLSANIPQLDGPVSDPYDEMLSTPNIFNYQGIANEDYNVANTPAPNDIQAATPAMVTRTETVDEEDDEDEPLNENDDDDYDDLDDGEEQDTTHLVLAQFDKVTRTKSRWKCTLKDGIMHINNKDILFNKATGEFEF